MASTSVITLLLNTTSAQLSLANFKQSMSTLGSSTTQAGNQFTNLGKTGTESIMSIKTAIAGLVGAIGFGAISAGVTDTIREFEALKASMKTVTGSETAGLAAFEMIKEFAATTPFQLKEVTDAFNIMSRVGIIPTKEELKDFGNIAAGMGKPITQFAEAVADAVTGEFERLKEFGIKAANNGKMVSFMFRGQSTEIQNNAKAIEAYLRQLGQTAFATGLEDQAKTLNGVISNIKDNFSLFAYEIGEGGLKTALYDVLKDFMDLTGSSKELANSIGATLGSAITSVKSAFQSLAPYAEEIKAVLVGITAGAITAGLIALAGAAAAATASFVAMAAAFVATPVGAIVTAIGAAAAALYYYRDTVVTVGTTQATVWEVALGTYDMVIAKTQEWAQASVVAFNSWMDIASSSIGNVQQQFAGWLQEIGAPEAFVQFVQNFNLSWNTVKDIALNVMNGIINLHTTWAEVAIYVAKNFVEVFVSSFRAVGDAGATLFKALGEAMTTFSAGPLQGIGQKMRDSFVSGFGQVGQDISRIITEGMNRTPIQDAAKFISDGAKNAMDSYKNTVEEYVIARQRQATVDELVKAATDAQTDSLRKKGEAELDAMRNRAQATEVDKAAIQARETFIKQLQDEIFATQNKIATVGMDATATANYISQATAEKLAVDEKTMAQVQYLNSLRDSLEQKQRDGDFTKYLDNLKEETRILQLNRSEREIQMKLLQTNRQFNNELSAEQKITLEDAVRANQAATDAARERDKTEDEANRKVIQQQKDIQYEYKRTAEVAGDSASDIAKSLFDVASQGSAYIPQLLKSMVVGVANIIKAAFSRTEAGFFTEFFSGMGGAFGGFRAEGGPVIAGVPYIVGEKQAELFVPQTSGYILPTVPVASNSNTPSTLSMSISIGNVNTAGTGSLSDSEVRQLTAGILQAMHKKIVSEKRYGGILAA
jgi:hypothetical protein